MPKHIDGEIMIEPDFEAFVMRLTRTLPRPSRQAWDHLANKDHLHEWLAQEPGMETET